MILLFILIGLGVLGLIGKAVYTAWQEQREYNADKLRFRRRLGLTDSPSAPRSWGSR